MDLKVVLNEKEEVVDQAEIYVFDLQEYGDSNAGNSWNLKDHLSFLNPFYRIGRSLLVGGLEQELSPQDDDGHTNGQEREAYAHDEFGSLNGRDRGHGKEERVGGGDYDPQPTGRACFREEGFDRQAASNQTGKKTENFRSEDKNCPQSELSQNSFVVHEEAQRDQKDQKRTDELE